MMTTISFAYSSMNAPNQNIDFEDETNINFLGTSLDIISNSSKLKMVFHVFSVQPMAYRSD